MGLEGFFDKVIKAIGIKDSLNEKEEKTLDGLLKLYLDAKTLKDKRQALAKYEEALKGLQGKNISMQEKWLYMQKSQQIAQERAYHD